MTQSKKIGFIYLPFISILFVTFAQVSYVTAYKMVDFGSLLLPAGILSFPLIYTISDIVAEVYGYKRVRRLLWESALSGLLFSSLVLLFIHLPSPAGWPHQQAYEITLGKICRIYGAVITGVTVGSFVNIYLITKWKILVKGRVFWLRSFFSTAIGEAVVTLITDSLAFINVMPIHQVEHMVISIYIFKLVYALIAAFPANFIVYHLKRKEQSDVYDYYTKFNPFSLELSDEPTPSE